MFPILVSKPHQTNSRLYFLRSTCYSSLTIIQIGWLCIWFCFEVFLYVLCSFCKWIMVLWSLIHQSWVLNKMEKRLRFHLIQGFYNLCLICLAILCSKHYMLIPSNFIFVGVLSFFRNGNTCLIPLMKSLTTKHHFKIVLIWLSDYIIQGLENSNHILLWW